MTPHAQTRFRSPAASTPPGSGSSTASWFDGTQMQPPSDSLSDIDPDITVRQSHPTRPLDDLHFASQGPDQDLGPLPALFPSELAPVTPMASSSSTSSLDLSSAPRGPRTWPWRYVCDMAAGFDAMRALQDSTPKVPRDDAFTQVFRHKFTTSTFNQQHSAWRAAGKIPGERERWVAAGRSDRGEWSAFMREWWGKK